MSDPAGRADLLQSLAALEALLAEIAEVIRRTDDGRRLALVRLRQRLAEQIAAIGRLADPFFAGRDSYRDYRTRFSDMRAMTAMHQAAWPAVTLGEDPEGFRSSAQPMRAANAEFIRWMRSALGSKA